ncbi:MAG: META domain-containing protein [Gaiella sp.]|nr:META domain-containing protein [Gaiella sp.]
MRRDKLHRSLPLVVVGTVAAVAALTAATAVATASGSTSASPLTGKAWILTSLAGKPPLADTELTAEFTPKLRVSGSAGCNRFAGSYRVSGRTIRISPSATTMMACAGPIQRQETAFLNALSSARSFAVRRGILLLRSSDGRVLARFRAQSQVLAGTSWNVLAYNNGKQAVVSVLAGTKLTAVFGRDGRLTGHGGCNNYNADFKGVPRSSRSAPLPRPGCSAISLQA